MSLSARRAWIEIIFSDGAKELKSVALRKESVDRNLYRRLRAIQHPKVALRKESVDRNMSEDVSYSIIVKSLSARRAWIEIKPAEQTKTLKVVALRKESVDRNDNGNAVAVSDLESLSARRAWIEIKETPPHKTHRSGRSPQGERG